MKYLKHFESQVEPTLKEKLESIVDMAYYLFDNDMKDGLNNFIGNCSVLFTGCVDVSRGFTHLKYPKRSYTFDINCLLKVLDNKKDSKGRNILIDDKLEYIEKLYPLSKIKKHRHTNQEIEKIFEPIFKIKSYGEDVIESHKIEKYFNGGKKTPCFSITLYLKTDIYYADKVEVEKFIDTVNGDWREENIKFAKQELKEIQEQFYYIRNEIKEEVKNLNLSKYNLELDSISDNTHLKIFYRLSIYIHEV